MTIRAMKFTPEVLLGAPRRSSAVPNASGTLAVYTQTSYSFDSHPKTNEIRVLEIATGHSTLITNDPGASNPQWLGTSDQLVWLKTKANSNTSFIIANAREPDKSYTAGTVPGPVSDLKVTTVESGKIGFAVSGRANPDGSLFNPHDAKKPLSSAKLYTKLFVRHWDAYTTPQKNAIWYGLLQQAPFSPATRHAGKYSVSGLTNLLAVSGLTGVECPMPPLGGSGDFDISPTAISFVAKDPGVNPATHTACSCYYCPMFSWTSMTASDSKICRIAGLRGAMSSPALSSDGSSIVLLAMREDGYESDKNRIMYVPNPWNGEMVEVFASPDGEGLWNLSPSEVSFAYDDQSLLIHVEEMGCVVLYQLSLEDVQLAKPDVLRKLTYSGSVSSAVPAAANSEKLFISGSSFVDNSLWTIIDPRTRDVNVVSSLSRNGVSFGLARSQVDEIWFQGAEDRVHAWVVKPSNFRPGSKYPLAYLIHGEQGYVVIAPNPTGSTGYGQAFTDAIRGSWGGLPYIDLVKGFEYIESHLDYVDTSRAVALGASYGGYMMNWIQGHPLGRKFKALVTHDGVFSMTSQLASDEQYFPLHDLKGPIWKVPEEWEKWDPSRFTENWATPHLIIHNERDYRLTIAEGLAAFNVLQMRGVDSAFLTFPDENHWVLNPENSLVWHHAVINWINKHVGLPLLTSSHGDIFGSEQAKLEQDMAGVSIARA
ncbi:dipeptidylpeptidase [Aspergillus sclerotialis]|uniref:Dipeptidyl-peptidase V n=1 Tax=Aspergillus sclerotialis TaxID=2070753 RepID=A0A3A2ZGK9_9EURO|nr:dipeptidylpeptidase [Aspergillus sclerotialis]